MSIPIHGAGLNVTMMSYADTLNFGFVGDSDAVPHLQHLAVYTGEAFTALRAAFGLQQPRHCTVGSERPAPRGHTMVVGTVVSAARGILSGTKEPLHGRTVFVTGAARGLGAEVARQAHATGAQVALVGRRLPPLEELATELGCRAIALEADVTDMAALERAAQATVDAFGGIDLVVANAGIAPPSDTIWTIDPAAFERTIEVNLLGQWGTIRATLPTSWRPEGTSWPSPRSKPS